MQDTGKLVCKNCGSFFIQNKKLQLCSECVFKKNHKGKSQEEVYLERQKNKPQKEQKPILSKKPYVYKYKPTGEKELFLQIWSEKTHYCENCQCFLGHEPKSFYFAHIIPKGVDRKLRLVKDNIRLLCWDCHYALDMRGKEAYEKRTKK